MNLLDPSQVHGNTMEIARTNPNHLPGRYDQLPQAPESTGFRDALIGSLEEVNGAQMAHEQLSVQAVVDPESMRCVGPDGRALVGHLYAVGDAESGSDLKPEGLLSTGLAGAYIATHAAFPEEIEEIGAPAIARASSP